MGHSLTDYLTLPSAFLQVPIPKIAGSLRGRAPQQGKRRAGPLATAERAASTSRGGVERVSERRGERIAMHGSPPLSEC